MVEAQGKATISNDGATIMKLLDVVHPAAKTLVDIAKSQDAEVGDGTTSVVLLAGEFLKQMKPFIEEGVHSQIIIRSVRKATAMAIQFINEIAEKVLKFLQNCLHYFTKKVCSNSPRKMMRRNFESCLRNVQLQL